jgi:hypothetical protein
LWEEEPVALEEDEDEGGDEPAVRPQREEGEECRSG